ncbi:hypothetical protein HAV25_19855, partial [Elizabethkingia miricola]|nr:hypothetical protein [Elizabethkingia miricola]
QIIAKLQRKSRNLTDENKEHISYHTNGNSIEGLIQSLKNTTGTCHGTQNTSGSQCETL